MKISINLLPQERKDVLAKKKFFAMLIRQEFAFLFAFSLMAILLYALNWTVKFELNSVVESKAWDMNNEGHRELKKYEDKFKEINKKTKFLSSLDENHLRWTNVLTMIDGIIPQEISLTHLSTQDYRISIAGVANERDDLLRFQEKMAAVDCFSEINVPLSNLVNKNNVDFQMEFKVSEGCLKSD